MTSTSGSRRRLAVSLISGLVLAVAGCSNNTPTTPTITTTATTDTAAAVEVFSGTLSPRGTGFYSFQATGNANATFTLASLVNPTTGRPVTANLQLGIGIPAGEGCSVTNAVSAAPGLQAQLTSPVVIGTYCVQVADTANSLPSAVTFAVRIQRP